MMGSCNTPFSTRRDRIIFGLLLVLYHVGTMAEPIQVVDDRGRAVTLSQPARRVITLGPSVTELVYAAGGGDTVIAVDNASDFPAAVKSLARVGGLNALDLEKIVALQPDLIVVWDSGYHSGEMDRLATLTTIYYADPKKLPDIATTLERLGNLTGVQRQANEVSQRFVSDLGLLEQRYRHRPRIPAFYQVWMQPLMTIGKAHSINDVMQLCGVENIFSDSELIVPRVDIELVLLRKPRLLIIDGERLDAATQTYWQHWLPGLQDHIVGINPDLLVRPTPRILQGAAQLCEFAEQRRTAKVP